MSARLKAMGQARYRRGFEVTVHPEALPLPLTWTRPQMVFVNSMGDLFHRDVPIEFIQSVFDVMRSARQHTFQILTKRARRLALIGRKLDWPSNVWMGVSVESQDYKWRIDCLREVGAAVRFISFEPLLDSVSGVELDGIHWAIVGGESGPGARPMCAEWARDIRDQCLAAGVPFFFKQWGGVRRRESGRVLDGRVWDEYPSLGQPSLSVA
jgi:protein gp37